MRTSRLARWLISGALVAATAASAHGGQTVESGIGAKTLSSESAQQNTASDELTGDDGSSTGPMSTTGFEWG